MPRGRPIPQDAVNAALPEPFAGWFAARGWAPRTHQLALLERARAGKSTLLIAPTGAGKTLAGFLPSLVELAPLSGDLKRPHRLHTIYVSPLKALAVDVLRNLETPAAEMGLRLRIESRTGDRVRRWHAVRPLHDRASLSVSLPPHRSKAVG